MLCETLRRRGFTVFTQGLYSFSPYSSVVHLVQLRHCIEQDLKEEKKALALPYGIPSIEGWGLMLCRTAAKDAAGGMACDHAFAQTISRLLAVTKRLYIHIHGCRE